MISVKSLFNYEAWNDEPRLTCLTHRGLASFLFRLLVVCTAPWSSQQHPVHRRPRLHWVTTVKSCDDITLPHPPFRSLFQQFANAKMEVNWFTRTLSLLIPFILFRLDNLLFLPFRLQIASDFHLELILLNLILILPSG